MHVPMNPAGGPVLACEIDEKCAKLDCETLGTELRQSLADNPEAPEYVAYYCGLDYLAKLQAEEVTRKSD